MLRAVLDSMPDNISIKDLQGRYIFDNSSHCRFLGATNTADIVGKTVFDFLPARIAAKFHAEDLRVLQSGAVVQSVDETVDVAGNRVWMSVTKMPLRDDAGELIGLVSTTRDITERKQTEEQLATYAEALREKNTQLEADLETARELQYALLPQQYPRFPSCASPGASALRFHHFFRSSSGVGGDFFDVFQLSDSMAGVFICDVMGHGVRAALVAAIVRALVEDFARPRDRTGKVPSRAKPGPFPHSETHSADDVCIGVLPDGRHFPRRTALRKCRTSDPALRAPCTAKHSAAPFSWIEARPGARDL
jgi:sigma-B regulation protein RsbU (phosphoserine phosphatase)